MERSSKIVQWALYVLLLMVPLTAIIGAWLEDHPVTLLGFGSIAPMVQGSRPIGEILSDLHGLIGDSLIWLVGVHGAAALFHHFWLRDNVLWSMSPWVSRH
jgi:cytochrome b561